MKKVCFGVLLAMAAGAQRGGPPSVSLRPPDAGRIRNGAAGLLGWKVGVPAGVFPQLTLWEAAAKVDALGAALIEGSNLQKVSPEISRNLDYNLAPAELGKVKQRLGELRLRMAAYRTDTIPTDGRRLFEFAKSLGVETIISGAEAPSLSDLDRLANEFGIDVALERTPKSVAGAFEGRSRRIGVNADLGRWAQQGIKPLDGLSLVKDRLLAVRLRDVSGGTAGITRFLLELSRLQPPGPPEWPPKCANCTGPRVEVKPLFIAVETTAAADLEAMDRSLRPAMGYRANEIARQTPITSADRVPPEERRKIEAALPAQALVKPAKPRKLLVIDICPAGGYYHATIAHANLALELMAKRTGAFQPVFSNDLNNLKYPAIRQFDAVFLNSVVGEVFPDPDVLNGLLRFVREGGGVAGIHGATYASMDLPEYGEMMGAQDGPHRVEPSVLKIDDPDSPLTKAFGGKDFPYVDEFYHFLPTGPYSRDKLHVLISINAEKTDLSRWKVRPDNDYGLSWIKSYGKGRVFNCAMGHTPELFATPALAEHILAAIQFVLGDLKADTTPSARLTAMKDFLGTAGDRTLRAYD